MNLIGAKASNYTFYCPNCKYWGSSLLGDIESASDSVFDEKNNGGDVLDFVDRLRTENFVLLLSKIEEFFHHKKVKVLDIGCATGLFIKLALKRGHQAIGVEPNPRMVSAAKMGDAIINGYFPQILESSNKFDVIIFNDVLEHLPNLDQIIIGVFERLNQGGILIINLPNSGGIVFRIGRLLSSIGFLIIWDRLWQKMFYTPHLHYFNSFSLDKFLIRHSFEKVLPDTFLPIASIYRLWDRINVDNSSPLLVRIFTYFCGVLSIPWLGLFERDILVVFYQKKKF